MADELQELTECSPVVLPDRYVVEVCARKGAFLCANKGWIQEQKVVFGPPFLRNYKAVLMKRVLILPVFIVSNVCYGQSVTDVDASQSGDLY